MHVQFLRDTIYPNQVINRLNQERLLLLGQGIDSEISNQLTSLMVYQSIEDVNWTAQEEIIGLLKSKKNDTKACCNFCFFFFIFCFSFIPYEMP